jgi:hypothetical protein
VAQAAAGRANCDVGVPVLTTPLSSNTLMMDPLALFDPAAR